MSQNDGWRYVVIQQEDGTWKRDDFENVRKGDLYYLYDPTGCPIGRFRAVEDPEDLGFGNWRIHNELYIPE
jgi:hypothetical protein